MRNWDKEPNDNKFPKRKGSFAIYLEPWHGDIMDFLDLKKNHGKEEMRARDLFYGIWMCDLFMQRVEQDLPWSLMCPHQSPGLDNVYGEEFIALYEKYEKEGNYLKRIKARDVWYKILEAQMETGTPYLLYKDAANVKSNQMNIGVLKTSNLCLAGDTNVTLQLTFHDDSKDIRVMTLEKLDELIREQKEGAKDINIHYKDEVYRAIGVAPPRTKSVSILSYNTNMIKVEFKEVLASARTNNSAKVMKITDEITGKSIVCTPEHQVFTRNRGYVMAKDLVETDTLFIS